MSECVYRHTAPDGRMYIGIAQEPPKIRWANGKGYKNNPEFWKCICDVGWSAIKHEILASGLSRGEALKVELELIDLYGTLTPNGFNRRRDDPEVNRYKHKKEVGCKYGHGTVVNYWPDEEGWKVYTLRCECGNLFKCHVFDLSDDTSCGCRDENSTRA